VSGGERPASEVMAVGGVDPRGLGVRWERKVGERHLTGSVRRSALCGQATGVVSVVEAGDGDRCAEQRREGRMVSIAVSRSGRFVTRTSVGGCAGGAARADEDARLAVLVAGRVGPAS
jgi:hypothetical protein